MEYNTARNYLEMREYGRHIQKMVEHLLTLDDKQKRNQQTSLIIELMGALNPHLKNVADFRHMLWDHLFFMSGFKLDVDSPYPIPEKETYKAKTQPMGYPKRKPKYSHLGKNLELVINKALDETDADKKEGFANSIAYYMKLSYSNWHKELIHDDQIRSELNKITGGALEFSNTPFIKHRVQPEKEEFGRSNARRQNNFGARNNNNRNNNNTNRNNNGNTNRNESRTNGVVPSQNNRNSNSNNNNRNFKKRF